MLWRIKFWLERFFTSPEERANEAVETAKRDAAFDQRMETLRDSPPLRTLDQLHALIDANGLQPAKDFILSRVLPCFYLIHTGPGTEAPLGATRLGGAPDLPAGSEWPRGEWGYMNFHAQFSLADLRACGAIGPGHDGHVCLFVSSQESAADPVGVHAVVVPANTPLVRLTPPADETEYADIYSAHLKPVTVAFEPGLSLPFLDGRFSSVLAELAPGGDTDSFEDSLYNAPETAIGQLLGYANTSHADDIRFAVHMHRIGRSDLQYADHIRAWESWEDTKKSHARNGWGLISSDEDVRWLLDHRAELDAAAEGLQLLVRIDSNHPMGLSINDWDPIYFFAPADRLQASDFSDMAGAVTQG